ncbi:hypothetical protein [Paenibacillus sp. BK720]|uniref:hypothetical protein n=1 Tax=Paenibacillus sp. BK720 TaxID=2587092 RepID=UPI001FB92236|nr:hypothetical protein [Paenibacillus sp. BK720]NIK67911.1 ferric-dicitrate binding protein FerR (iron transport regulator) [Paenibacillus sp. BK720]
MPKPNIGKGYEQRQKDKKRTRAKDRQAKQRRKERAAMFYEKDYGHLTESRLEEKLQQQQETSKRYRNAWEAEKLLNTANNRQIKSLRDRLSKGNRFAFKTGLLIGALSGAAVVNVVIAILLWAVS